MRTPRRRDFWRQSGLGSKRVPVLIAITMMTASAAAGVAAAGPPEAAPTIGVMCALPYQTGRPGADCQGTHTVRIKTVGTSPAAKVAAEILALDADGSLLSSLPTKDGDAVQMASRQNDKTVRWIGNHIEAFAPIPLLHVTVEDQGQKAEAFCSNIPWVDVLKPNGGVVTSASGDGTHVLAAVPLTNPAALHLYVDGNHQRPARGVFEPDRRRRVEHRLAGLEYRAGPAG
jgi:hypothetical protein